MILGPGINMKRSPLCGRNFEYFSEDPFLAGELAVGIVDGIQSRGVGTSVKHYAANNQETDRLRVDAQVDERTLREIYLPAFERVVTASQPWTVMCSYNKVNGLSASENPWLLTTVLREEFGFEGLVVSDWGAVYHRVPALLAGHGPGDAAGAAAAARRRSSPRSSPARCRSRCSTPGSVRCWSWSAKGMAVLDLDETFDADAHHALAREAAARVGRAAEERRPAAARARRAASPWSASSPARRATRAPAPRRSTRPGVDVLLDELRRRLRRRAVRRRLRRRRDRATTRRCSPRPSRSPVRPTPSSWCSGCPAADESEGFDRTHLDLPANQLATLEAVAAVNPNVVVVLANGSTVVLGDVTPYAEGAGRGLARRPGRGRRRSPTC